MCRPIRYQISNHLAHAAYGDMSFGLLGAGPLEDLISDYGDEIVPEIEQITHGNPVFRSLLGCIYRRKSLSDDGWARLEACREKGYVHWKY